MEALTIQWMRPRPDLHCRHCRDLNRSLLALSRRLVSIVANNSAARRGLTIPLNGGIAATKVILRDSVYFIYTLRLGGDVQPSRIIMLIFLIDGAGSNSTRLRSSSAACVFSRERERFVFEKWKNGRAKF